jgi:hypothetical protein
VTAPKDYTKSIATAKRLIEKFGRSITLRRRALDQSQTDTNQPWKVTAAAPTDVETYGVFIDPRNSEDNYDFAIKSEYRTDRVRIDLHIIVPSLYDGSTDAQVEPGDLVVDAVRGKTYTVITASPLAPGDLTCAWILQVQL